MAPLNPEYYHLVERYEIRQKQFATDFFTVFRPYERKGIAHFADSLLGGPMTLSAADRFNLLYLLNDNWEWAEQAENDSKKPILRHFFEKKSDFFHVQTDDFDLHLNPVLHLSWGADNNLERAPFINTRGVEVRGMISKKVGFYSFLSENQVRFPSYVQDFTRQTEAVPGEGFWKVYQQDGHDFLTARGYIVFNPIKNISLQFGQDRLFTGHGYRSLILSDFSNNYLFMRLSTKVWKLQYTNVFAQMVATNSLSQSVYPKKYLAYHHLSLNLTPSLNIGLFESVTFSRQDANGRNYFDPAYLNPVIFYRAIEHNSGDADNVILGADFKWNFLKGMQLYGQLVIDELIVGELRSGDGWWGNKHAGQLGFRYVDALGVNNLDLQAELNVVRPYTYTHFMEPAFGNHQHYTQPLAHPLGANFQEYVGLVRYQPLPRLTFWLKGMYARRGLDRPGENWGGNIFLDYTTRQQEYGNKIGQGIAANWLFAELTGSFQLRHNLFAELFYNLRTLEAAETGLSEQTRFWGAQLRWNMPRRRHAF